MSVTKDSVFQYFKAMAEGKVSDTDIMSNRIGKNLGGRRHMPIHYQIKNPSSAAATPTQNLTSMVAANLDQARARSAKNKGIISGDTLETSSQPTKRRSRKHRSKSSRGQKQKRKSSKAKSSTNDGGIRKSKKKTKKRKGKK